MSMNVPCSTNLPYIMSKKVPILLFQAETLLTLSTKFCFHIPERVALGGGEIPSRRLTSQRFMASASLPGRIPQPQEKT